MRFALLFALGAVGCLDTYPGHDIDDNASTVACFEVAGYCCYDDGIRVECIAPWDLSHRCICPEAGSYQDYKDGYE